MHRRAAAQTGGGGTTKPSKTATNTSTNTAASDSNADIAWRKPAEPQPARKRQVILVCGPPCGGKSTFVVKNADPDDTILCIDTLAQRLGSPVTHNHTGSMYGNAEKHYWEMAGRIARHPTIHAWVLRCAPEPEERMRLAQAVRATQCVVLLPPIQVAATRARLRDADPGATIAAISSWYGRWHAAPFDRVLRNG